jgi:paired amphipathic helix protein Sin3a
VLYSRLALFKRLGAKLSVKRSPNAAAEPDMILASDSGTDLHAAHAEHYYALMLESCERLFDNEIEIGAFEELTRNMFGVKVSFGVGIWSGELVLMGVQHAYKIFTIDKLIGVLIKQVKADHAPSILRAILTHVLSSQVQIALPDPKTKDLIEILKRERAIVAPTTQDHVNSRRNAEKVLGPDENLFRIDWVLAPLSSLFQEILADWVPQVPDSKMMTIQLLGKDDLGFGDSEVLTGRWQAYVDSFVSVCFYCLFDGWLCFDLVRT